MKKIFFFFFLSFEFYVLSFPISAIDPVIINDANPGHPPANNPLPKDPYFFSQNINGIPTVKCSGTYSISQSFEPHEETTTDPNTGEKSTSFTPYDVNKIVGAFLPVQEKWTNKGLDEYRRFLASRQKAISGSLQNIKKGFLSLNPDKAIGASNAARRGTPNRIARCLKGQRMVKAVQYLSGQPSEYVDEQVAWDCGGSYMTVVDQEKNPCGGQPVLISDIAFALDSNPTLDVGSSDPSGKCSTSSEPTYLFYDPSANCNIPAPSPGAPTPGPLTNWASGSPLHQIPSQDACMLYRATVEAADIGASPRKFTTCSLENDQPVDCEDKISNGPWLQAYPYSSNKSSINHLIKPQKQPISPVDICATGDQKVSANKPNPLSFVKYAAEFFGTVTDTVMNFSHPMSYDIFIDKQVQDGISSYETSLKQIVPAKVQKTAFAAPQPPSSTDDQGKTVDPGNPYTQGIYSQQLLPKSWQNSRL